MNSILSILFAGLCLQFVFAVAVRYYFIRCLKRQQPATWETLGRPGPFPFASAKDSFSMLGYFINRDYRASQDRSLIRLGSLYRTCLIVYFCYFIGFVVVFLVFLRG